ncbi:MAG: C_GCAxxG_C_C family protein [Candidatus Bathyarchaeota archaeon]|nr:MAG: C_GCAxxG_C_C family protein [Candidatus Bathyarchaeota archaeon]
MVEEKPFNCAEKVLLNANNTLQLPDIKPCLKMASGCGGGVSGRGSICGALNGGVMALGLQFGTDGSETLDTFTQKRKQLRALSLDFLMAFEEEFGTIECRELLGYELWTENGTKQYQAAKAAGLTKCQDYIAFSSALITKLLKTRSLH